MAIVSVLPAKNVSNTKLQAELRKRLKSKSFSVERIAILDDQNDDIILIPHPKRIKETVRPNDNDLRKLLK